MEGINWVAVIVSVIISTITATMITYHLLVNHLKKSDDNFLKDLEKIKLETLDIIRNKRL
jgi:hypothetical protein